jgi:sulfate permease, SulP family
MTSEKATVPLLRAVAKGPVPSSMGPVDHPVRTRAAKLKASELVVDEDGVVRGKLEQDPKCTAFLLYDLEGELFFGAAPEPERYFDELTQRARAEGIRYIVLRVKRIRNPDVVCLEQFEHILKSSASLGITVLLAGARSNFLEALQRLKFVEWYPEDQIFPQAAKKYSATLAAVRSVYERLDGTNTCKHCASKKASKGSAGRLYYPV